MRPKAALDGLPSQLSNGVSHTPFRLVVIDILIEDERGQRLASFPNVLAVEPALFASDGSTHCLQYIDRYGDTVFNQAQTHRLCTELQQRADAASPEVRYHVQQLIAFLQPVVDGPHLYARFLGD